MSNEVIEVLVPGPQGAVGDASSLRGRDEPEPFDGSQVYLTGSRVLYQDKEYISLADTVVGVFVIAMWKEVSLHSIEERLTSLEAAVLILQG